MLFDFIFIWQPTNSKSLHLFHPKIMPGEVTPCAQHNHDSCSADKHLLDMIKLINKGEMGWCASHGVLLMLTVGIHSLACCSQKQFMHCGLHAASCGGGGRSALRSESYSYECTHNAWWFNISHKVTSLGDRIVSHMDGLCFTNHCQQAW